MDHELRAPCGRLVGRRDVASGVSAFLGIPYARPPIGPLRWLDPQRLEPWSGLRDATAVARRCIQHAPYGELEPDSPGMSEDCLYLNVWTPNVAQKLAVIFWIHGGEFWAGSGSEPRYNGAALASRGVVVVTINHRLGVFGFLSHPELSAQSKTGTSGNYGLLDQVAALRWTIDNIAAFGGDPNNITVAGKSAGSCSVSFLMASMLSKRLFQRALGQSCSYFMPETHPMKPLTHDHNEELGLAFARAANAGSVQELRALSGEELLAVWLRKPQRRMQPCIDGHILPDVAKVFAAGEQANVPLLLGWNGDEYGFIRAAKDVFDPTSFKKRLEDAFGAHAEPLLLAYTSDHMIDTAADLSSDRLMVWPTWRWAKEHAKQAPVYVYCFDRALPSAPYGAVHASELEYVFGVLDSKLRNYTNEDRVLSQQMGDYWTNFAQEGDPNGSGLTPWPPFDTEEKVLHLDGMISAKPLTSARLEMLSRAYAHRQFL